ncbi:Clp protease ClpB [Sporosarcina sp. ANT_H38]|uniref:Clp protease ClpB n=1 Tax=Sporosarcina sp. ANT_H38 TaxID=2597358 RepID=UPI0011F25F23|nr:Clp protease ClpB [Sporosarcina sp. ANT_H38]KAA0955395.1 Clp protease ClpB [Sporosarcina sp. ANT_H38]
MKQLTYFISALIVGISIIISGFIISNTFSNSASEDNNSQPTTNSIPEVMTKTQLSGYLQISEQSIENIIKEDEFEKAKLQGSFDTYRFIPYFNLENQERFLKAEINEWLQYKNDHR